MHGEHFSISSRRKRLAAGSAISYFLRSTYLLEAAAAIG